MSVHRGHVPEGVHDVAYQAHLEDSRALAEHLPAEKVAARLRRYEDQDLSPGLLLHRAWLYLEHALSTAETNEDAGLFAKADKDIDAVLSNKQLHPRNKTAVNARLLRAYRPIFEPRSRREPVSAAAQSELQKSIGKLLLDFMDEDHGAIAPTQYGTLSELIVPYGLLYRKTLPYLTSPREESNLLANDNHDFYTLHPCDKNRVKKVPLSVKHAHDKNPLIRPDLPKENIVVTLRVGKLALDTARNMPEAYTAKRANYHGYSWASREAADIMVCHALNEPLDASHRRFMRLFTARLLNPIIAFANSKHTPDYLLNATTLESL